jgi:hypothetical protein
MTNPPSPSVTLALTFEQCYHFCCDTQIGYYVQLLWSIDYRLLIDLQLTYQVTHRHSLSMHRLAYSSSLR